MRDSAQWKRAHTREALSLSGRARVPEVGIPAPPLTSSVACSKTPPSCPHHMAGYRRMEQGLQEKREIGHVFQVLEAKGREFSKNAGILNGRLKADLLCFIYPKPTKNNNEFGGGRKKKRARPPSFFFFCY